MAAISNWGRDRGRRGRAGVAFQADAVALWLGEHQLDWPPVHRWPSIAPPASTYLKERAAGAYPTADRATADNRGRSAWPWALARAKGLAWGATSPDQYSWRILRRLHHLTPQRAESWLRGFRMGKQKQLPSMFPGPGPGGRFPPPQASAG